MLAVQNLSVAFGPRRVVDEVSFTLDQGETLALVGESGSGKSLTALSVLQLLPAGAGCTGSVRLDGKSMLDAPPAVLQAVRGDTAGIVFQEPMTSLNPLHSIGRQVGEALALHGRKPARGAVADLLRRVGFPDADARLADLPGAAVRGRRLHRKSSRVSAVGQSHPELHARR